MKNLLRRLAITATILIIVMLAMVVLPRGFFTSSATTTKPQPTTTQNYNKIIKDNNLEPLVVTPDNREVLSNRNGRLVIEKIIGEVVDDDLNGKVINTENQSYNYISYMSVRGCKKGNIILTYCVYNPDTNYVDDIIERFDYIIDDKTE